MSTLPSEIEVRDEFDGRRYLLPSRRESPARWGTAMLLVVIGVMDTIVVTGILLLVLGTAGSGSPNSNVSPGLIAAIIGAVALGGLALVVFGLWIGGARTEIELGPNELRSRTCLGPLTITRTRSLTDIAGLSLARDRIRGANIPGGLESPDFLALRAEGDAGRPTLLAAGYHRRILAPLAAELAARMGVEGPGDSPSV
ncbi:MAG: hypothetical protein EA376_12760 [Phycisphaeraceae bacterium]|nr:MAG: hypothetical protein EA376_12760 [Phycisphaeraceae bacterium]